MDFYINREGHFDWNWRNGLYWLLGPDLRRETVHVEASTRFGGSSRVTGTRKHSRRRHASHNDYYLGASVRLTESI